METPVFPAFGPLLKRYRRAAHLTQAQLAERAGFSTNYISKLERGAREPQRATVALLADAMSLSMSDRRTLESTVQRSRARHDGEATQLPIGGFLGAVPAGPLVGRAAELEAIASTLETVASGQGRFLALVGEPGVGKTRLAQEITLLAQAQGYRVLTGRCYEPHQAVAYYPFLEALSKAVAATHHGWDQVATRWPEVARLLPEHTASAVIPAQLDDRNAQQRLFWQVTGFLSALAESAPLALLVDDVHWADSDSVDLLQHLARHLRERPVLLVGTARGRGAPPTSPCQRAQRFASRRTGPDHSRAATRKRRDDRLDRRDARRRGWRSRRR
jgi:DNA-binding XRE family transcriptional regulator